jgi:hypothetical protein
MLGSFGFFVAQITVQTLLTVSKLEVLDDSNAFALSGGWEALNLIYKEAGVQVSSIGCTASFVFFLDTSLLSYSSFQNVKLRGLVVFWSSV